MITNLPTPNSLLQLLFLAVITFGLSNKTINAQCNGNLTLSTQAQVDAFNCTTFDGNLTISGPDIVNLNVLANSSGLNLTMVTGDLTVTNCPNLTSLQGLDLITSVGGSFTISELPELTTMGGFGFLMNNVGSLLQIINCPKFASVSNFGFLSTLGDGLLLFGDLGITSYTGFNVLTSSPIVQFWQTNVTNIDGFEGLTNVSFFNIDANPNLQSVTGFNSLQSVVPGMALGINYDYFRLSNNANLNQVSGLTSLTNLNGGEIMNNPMLSGCCFALPIINNNASLSVSGNAPGCESVSAIDAPPVLTNCPADQNYGTDPDLCSADISLMSPAVTDCDLANFTWSAAINGQTVLSDVAITSSELITGLTTAADWVITFKGTDLNNQSSTCAVNLSIVDNQRPTFTSQLPSDLTIFTSANSCEATHMLTFPPAIDNCGISNREISVYSFSMPSNFQSHTSPLEGQSYSFNLVPGSYGVSAKIYDARGSVDSSYTSLTVVDNTAPNIVGVPTDITIGCNDPYPQTPNPTITDNCDPNPSVTVASSVTMGDCTLGGIAQTETFSWSATDAAGNISTDEWKVTVVSDFSFDLGEDVSLCDEIAYVINPGSIGQSYLWSTGSTDQVISVGNTGTYAVTITSSNGCCYADEITVTLGTSPDASATGAVLSCSAESVMIMGSSTTANVTYSWTGPGGFTSNDQNPAVTSIGEYMLTVSTVEGCETTATAMVSADIDVPDISGTGGSLNCIVSEIQLFSESTTASVQYSWIGPNNFTSTDQNPTVSAAGIYTVTALAPNGCDATTDVEVLDDTNAPDIAVTASLIDCNEVNSQISSTSTATIGTYTWAGPDGFGSNAANPIVQTGGTYDLTVTAENGCTNTATVEVLTNLIVPDVTVAGGTISCDVNAITITSASTTANVTYFWTGPNGFGSNSQNPSVTQAGTYMLIVTGPNGCTNTANAEVLGDSDLPNVNATGGQIDCTNESVTLQGSTSTEGATGTWTGPNGFTSSENNPVVNVLGTYTYTVVSTSGCQSFKEVQVTIDNKDPDITLAQGEVNCEAGTRQFILSTDQTEGTFMWEGPDGFQSTEIQPIYSLAGSYSVTITGTNGCTTSGTINVGNDVAYQHEIATNGNNAGITIAGGTPPFVITWDNETGGESTTNLSAGEHTVSVIDGLGCEKEFTFTITTSSTIDINRQSYYKVFPNPVMSELILEWSGSSERPSQVQIIDLGGRLIKSQFGLNFSRNGKTMIDVQELQEGIYFLKVISKGEPLMLKFLKM